jgi:hypothetical protein
MARAEPDGSAFPRRRALPPWSQEVLGRVVPLRNSLDHVDDAHAATIGQLLDAAERLATEARPWTEAWAEVREWWYGSRVEQAWTSIHEAQILLVEHADDKYLNSTALETALSESEILDPNDPIRIRLSDYARGTREGGAPPAQAKAQAHAQAHVQAHAGAVAAAPGGTTTTTTSTTTAS